MNTRNNDKPHFNIADVIIIVAIVAVVAALALRIYNVFGAKDSTTMVEIEFETELETDERVSFDEDEKLYLAADNTYAGTITDYHSENTFKYAYNEKGELVKAVVPGKITLKGTMVLECTKTEKGFYLGGTLLLSEGDEIKFYTDTHEMDITLKAIHEQTEEGKESTSSSQSTAQQIVYIP
jgi:hypothetical protein